MTTNTDAVPSDEKCAEQFSAWTDGIRKMLLEAGEKNAAARVDGYSFETFKAGYEAALAPASEVQADHIADERQAFEEWCLTFCGVGIESLEQTIGGAYVSGYVDDMWDGWKARASLASSTGNQEVGS